MFRFAEFFAGGGMVSAALPDPFRCVLANDIDPMKCDIYRKNFDGSVLFEGDIAGLDTDALKQPVHLYWASTPCQDLSLAGKGSGITGARSGVFFEWIEKVTIAARAGYAPPLIAFENVTGLVSRRSGADFTAVLEEFLKLGYRIGALEINSRAFLAQSRPRIFVIALRADIAPSDLCIASPEGPFHSRRLRSYIDAAPQRVRENWLWWDVPLPGQPVAPIHELLEADNAVIWKSEAETRALLSIMSETSLAKLKQAQRTGKREVMTAFKRGRPDETGRIRQRAELRNDGVAGCLRTPGGGSSRQTLVVAQNTRIRSRLVTPRETARLMGLSESYILPERNNDAYKITGDGVAVPVVRHIAEHIFQPVLSRYALRDAA